MAKKEVTPTPFQKFQALAKRLIAVPVGEVAKKKGSVVKRGKDEKDNKFAKRAQAGDT